MIFADIMGLFLGLVSSDQPSLLVVERYCERVAQMPVLVIFV
jgi:hypothetical protein